MKKRMTALLACLAILCVCIAGCNQTPDKPAKPNDNSSESHKKPQVVLSMNPSLVTAEGDVLSASKAVSDCMATDYKSGKASLYESTDWQWLYAAEEDTYIRRTVRAVESFKDGDGKTVKNAPYAYTVTDDRASSLAVYDTTKMPIGAYAGDSVAQTGILMAFTGSRKEALCYTAETDCTLSLCDVSGGSIALIKSVAAADTDILASSSPVGVVIGVSLNNRLLWQEVIGNSALLGEEKTAVTFPEIADIRMEQGAALVITAQLVQSAEGIQTGYFEIPGGTKLVSKTIQIGHEEEVKDDQNSGGQKGIYLLNKYGVSNFAVIASADANAEIAAVANSLRTRLEEVLGTDVIFKRDNSELESEYKILLGDTVYAESKAAKNELISGRSNNAADFIIRLVGKNVVIQALNKQSLQMAADQFIHQYCTDAKAMIPEGLNYVSSQHSGVRSLPIAGTDISNYRIVRSHVPSLMEMQAVNYLQQELVKLTGNSLEIVTDETPATSREIVVGTTNRSSADYNVKATVAAGNEYTVRVAGGKLFITGAQAYGVNAGVQDLIKKLRAGAALGEGFTFSGQYDGGYSLTNGYKLVWSDEFNGTDVEDPWTFDAQVNRETPYGGYLRDIRETSSVSDGALVQRTFTNDGKNFYGSSLRTDGKNPLWWRYGYCEIRVKYPTQVGATVGFCLFGTRHPLYEAFLEWDIVENFGKPWAINHTVHGWGSKHKQVNFPRVYNYKTGTEELEPFGTEYHTIGIEWDSDMLTFYLDGAVTSTYDCSDPSLEYFHAPVYVIISNSVGFFKDAEPGPDFYEDFSYTDYVRIYQKADNDSLINRPNR